VKTGPREGGARGRMAVRGGRTSPHERGPELFAPQPSAQKGLSMKREGGKWRSPYETRARSKTADITCIIKIRNTSQQGGEEGKRIRFVRSIIFWVMMVHCGNVWGRGIIKNRRAGG